MNVLWHFVTPGIHILHVKFDRYFLLLAHDEHFYVLFLTGSYIQG